MPVGELVTKPPPVPALLTLSVEIGLKVALTVLAAVMLTTHVLAVPVQAPDQPVNTESLAGAAVKVTLLLAITSSLQSVPQLIPAGTLVIVPLPVLVTLKL